jgi:hypothetical protein
MQLNETQKALEKFLKGTIADAKRNLQKQNTSGKLSKSLKYSLKVAKNSIDVDIRMEQYGEFQDKGVNGVGPAGKDRFGNQKKVVRNGVYKFGSGSGEKGGLTRGIDKWMVRKGIAPRNENGEFINRKNLKFLIARSIFRHGIKPSLFLTKAYQKNYKKLSTEITEKYGLDTEKTLDFLLKDLFK